MADVPQPKTTISLKTSDGNVIEVSPEIAKHMLKVQSLIKMDPSVAFTTVYDLPLITAFPLTKIIDYLNFHRKGKAVADLAKKFDEEFVKELSHDQMKQLLFAANYLNMKDVFEFLCHAVGELTENKIIESVRETFGIENDISPDLMKKLREIHAKVFEVLASTSCCD